MWLADRFNKPTNYTSTPLTNQTNLCNLINPLINPCRFGKNWIKLQLWNMTEYDGLMWLDADTVVLEDLRHVFQLPTAFAATLDVNKPHTQ